MVAVRSWKDGQPRVGHGAAIIWPVFNRKGSLDKTDEEAPLEGLSSLTVHALQAGKESNYHSHEDEEQVYYITKGRGKMFLDDKMYEVREGDAIHIPPPTKHQIVNDSDDWIQHLIISAPVERRKESE